MSEFYEIDSTRVSHAEMLMWHKSPVVLISWICKWFRIRTPCSSDDPNTGSTLPFITESLPPVISDKFISLANEIATLGFSDPVHHVIHDAGAQTTIYWATFRHESGKYFARIHQRIWQVAAKADRGTFLMFFTAFTDGTFLVSSAGKPDMTAPVMVQMNRMPQAGTTRLWEKHQQLSAQLEGRKNVIPVRSIADLGELTEQHHIFMRDFHLGRGVFRSRTSEEQTRAETYTISVDQAQAAGFQYPGIMAELDRLQDNKSGGKTLLVLIISLVLFIGLGALRWDWKFTLWLIPVLLFHESGHWMAMRIFHYRNLRIFFIPLFGAAVTGQNWNVPGWKKAMVALAGPLPGIALGVVLGVIGLLSQKAWLDEAALLLLFLNGLNLLPFLPLDGGRVVHVTLFCRNRWLDIIFRVLAVAGLMVLSIAGILGKVSLFLAITMAISLPLAFKLGQITDSLRKAALPPPLPGETHIPAATAEAIITALKSTSIPGGGGNKLLAQRTINIYETLNAHPPGALGTIGILALHGGSFLVAILFALLLVLGKNGGLGNFFKAAIHQGRHPIVCNSMQTWSGEIEQTNPPAVKNLLIATFANHVRAEAAYGEVRSQARATDKAVLFGDSILLAIPADVATARREWFNRFQAMTTNSFVAPSNTPVMVNLSFIAPTLTATTNLIKDMDNYFNVTDGMHLMPPWSPAARNATFDAIRRAREQWSRINAKMMQAWNDPRLKVWPQKIEHAVQSGDLAEKDRLLAEQAKARLDVEAELREQLRVDRLALIDPDLLDLQARLAAINETNTMERIAILDEVAAKLGPVASVDGHPVPGADDYGSSSAVVFHNRLLVHVSFLSLNDAATGLPALADWLCDQGCTGMRYDILGVTSISDDAD